MLWAAALCFGPVNCFGSLTVVVGSTVADPVAVCDIAVPPGLHSSAIDKTAGLATESNEALMAICRTSGTHLLSRSGTVIAASKGGYWKLFQCGSTRLPRIASGLPP